ncbi:MAG: hypothetical protein KAT17_00565, partial [Candidatus Aminicenantes bacterium]|nr:hypothetical protein [Candidatus Aminicenantes bacterium]
DYDIFLLLQSDTHESLEKVCDDQIKRINGVDEIDFLPVIRPILEESTANIINVAEDAFSAGSLDLVKDRNLGNRVCSYVLVEAEKERIDTVYPSLRLNENIVYCDYTGGKFNIVLLIHGSYFNEIDRVIQEKIINMEGVLRVKEYPIINLFEM